jgi:hypothetical protein
MSRVIVTKFVIVLVFYTLSFRSVSAGINACETLKLDENAVVNTVVLGYRYVGGILHLNGHRHEFHYLLPLMGYFLS